MGYACKDVEKTKKIAKKFVRYQEGAESCGKVNHRDVPMRGMYILIRTHLEDVNMFMHKTL